MNSCAQAVLLAIFQVVGECTQSQPHRAAGRGVVEAEHSYFISKGPISVLSRKIFSEDIIITGASDVPYEQHTCQHENYGESAFLACGCGPLSILR